jgi:O-methyltransferase
VAEVNTEESSRSAAARSGMPRDAFAAAFSAQVVHDGESSTVGMDLENVVAQVIEEVRPYTMATVQNLAATIQLAIEAIEAGRKGDFAECGTWMGGSSFAMLLAQRRLYDKIIKPVWMFDSFQGLPLPDERDGPLAIKYRRETDVPDYFDNCAAPLDKVATAIHRFGFAAEEAIVVPGWFNESLPGRKAELAKRGLAVLRVDCDFYEPVAYVLRELTPLIPEEGTIILDDYYAWDGCARATHDFLSQNNLSWRIRSMNNFHGAWMIKRAHRTGAL